MLYIDGEHLKSNEEIQAEFREFENPNLLKNEINFKVASIFSETVIVTDIYTSSCFLVISYRGFQIKLSRKIDASSCFQNHLQLLWTHTYDIYFLPGAARMAVRTDKSFVVIIDLRIFSKYFLKFKYSIYDRALYLLGADSDWSGIYDSERGEFILKFCFWQGMPLQELCLSEIVNYFGVSEIKSFSLPQAFFKKF